MRFNFHEEARRELQYAFEHYHDIHPNLGFALLDEVGLVIERLLEFPLSAPKFSPRLRKAVVKRFPYSLLYSVYNEEITVAAFMHHKRRPGYWKGRI
jgi:plasmid stabilization system protein ParE